MAETAADEPRSETLTEGSTASAPVRTQLPASERMTASGDGVLAIMPRSIPEAAAYADGLIKGGLVPDSFKKNGQVDKTQVMMGVLKALEIGVPPQTGLAGLYVVNNRFSVFGDLAAALVQRTGKVAKQEVQWIGESFDEAAPVGNWPDDFGCIVRYWRVGQESPYVGRYTVLDAKRARLWGSNRDPWQKYPKRMLFNRARAFALRDGFADGLHGLSIAEEVIDSLPPEEAKPRVAAISSLIDEDEGAEGPQ